MTKLLKAPLYAVSSQREHNGYDDSDFYRAMFDWNTGELLKVETGSTRYASGWTYPCKPWVLDTPEAVLERAERALADRIFAMIQAAERHDILEPSNAKRGDLLRLIEPHKSRKAGTTLPVGTKIRVNDCSAFGTFYRNGYNQPGRHNRSVVGTVVGHPEQLVRVPLAKCRLDQEPMSDQELRERAVELAKNRRFEQCWGRVF